MDNSLKSNDDPRRDFPSYDIIGRSKPMLEVYDLIEKVSHGNANILIYGETGTGKGLVAKRIHFKGPRRDKPFIAVDCTTIPGPLLENELFGHKKGAFTGAFANKPGQFELANGGTIFLDEIGDLPLELQAKILRVIQDKKFTPVGGNEVTVDVRILAATHHDLENDVKAGKFRNDLFWRLNVIQVKLPPLRERKDDIPLLTRHFLERFKKSSHYEGIIMAEGFTDEAMNILKEHNYLGNVRELENAIEMAVNFEKGKQITTKSLPPAFKATEHSMALPSETQKEFTDFENLLSSFTYDNLKSTFNKFKKLQLSKNDFDKARLLKKISSLIDWHSFFEELVKDPDLDPKIIAPKYSIDYVTITVEPILSDSASEKNHRGMLRSLSRMFSGNYININDFSFFPLDIFLRGEEWRQSCAEELKLDHNVQLRVRWKEHDKSKLPLSPPKETEDKSLILLPTFHSKAIKYLKQPHIIVAIFLVIIIFLGVLFLPTYIHLRRKGYACNRWSNLSSLSCIIHGYPKFKDDEIGILYNKGAYSTQEVSKGITAMKKSIELKFKSKLPKYIISSLNENIYNKVGIYIKNLGSDKVNNLFVESGAYIFFVGNSNPQYLIKDMVYIPGGKVNNLTNSKWSPNVGAYYIDKYEVTWDEYRLCVEESKCTNFSNANQTSEGPITRDHNFPVVYVSWYNADNFCNWAGKSLPSNFQWFLAASGNNNQNFTWGNNSAIECPNEIRTVGSFPQDRSPFGVMDMSCNVSEWISDPGINPSNPRVEAHWYKGGYNDKVPANASIQLSRPVQYTEKDKWFAFPFVGFRCIMDPVGIK